jgi:DNA polymerase-3 subunit epsilon
MREIVLDTETTGTDPGAGDRVIEIGCVELVGSFPTGRSFHAYLNPQRPVSEGAFRVHGLSDQFLSDKPLFAAICDEFVAFIEGAKLVIHNAAFDVGFLNAEFARLNRPAIDPALVVDTLSMARRKHPGASNSLDALCNRYGIDNSRRTRHGALLDAEILSEVYIELLGGKQADLGLAVRVEADPDRTIRVTETIDVPRAPRHYVPRISPAELKAHAAFVKGMGDKAVWRDYLGDPDQHAS